jgi:2-ketoarginine methyltransferase
VRDLSTALAFQERRLRGFLQYLANEGYLTLVDDQVSLTPAGTEVADIAPWYHLLVGGYAQTFQQISVCLKQDGPYATRNATSVGLGSCGISQHDALPMTRRLLGHIPERFRTVVDLGCGDGSYLVDLCCSLPGIRGIGIDSEPASVRAATQAATHSGVDDRVRISVGSASAPPDLSNEQGPLCFVTAFVLQELLEQTGRQTIIDLLTSTFTLYPDAHWVVIEVDHRPNDPAVMSHELGRAYYNPYYLLHQLTEQRLETVAFWRDLYREAGLQVDAMEYPDPSYDSLRLKVGFLLSRSDATSMARITAKS